MAESPPFSRVSIRMFSGVLIWAAHFFVIYSVTAIACERGRPDAGWPGIGLVPWVIGLATAAAVATAGWITVRSLRAASRPAETDQTSHFVDWMTASLCTLALIAIVWEALPVLLVPVCT